MNNQHINSLTEMHEFGKSLSKRLGGGSVCYFTGDLGAGKTSLIQGIMQGFEYTDAVTSPTYNLIHEYPTQTLCVYHIDLYRLNTPEEAFELGLEDIASNNNIVLIEWPEKGQGCIPKANCFIDIRTIAEKIEKRLVRVQWQ